MHDLELDDNRLPRHCGRRASIGRDLLPCDEITQARAGGGAELPSDERGLPLPDAAFSPVRRRVNSAGPPAISSGIPDLIGDDLRVLFCGINPGKLSGELGLHFARPGNRFWKLLHAGGFTDRVLTPSEQKVLPSLGVGITNLVERVTAAASELSTAELVAGAHLLERKAEALRPRCIAVLGLQAYRIAFHRPQATIGEQSQLLAASTVWMLPNPSGLQARYQLPEMTALFRSLYRATFDGP